MTALAVSDEHSPIGRLQILRRAQPDHFAAPQTAQDHCFDHRPVTPPASRSQQRDHRRRVQHLRQRPRCADQRCSRWSATGTSSACSHPARNGVRCHRIAQHQPVEQPRHHRQTTPDRARRQPGLTIGKAPHPTIALTTPLGGDELEHVRRRHRRRFLVDHREERLQVRHGRQHSVRPAPRRHELDIPIEHLSPPRRTYNNLQRRHSNDPRSVTCASPREAARSLTDYRNIYSSGRVRWHDSFCQDKLTTWIR